MSFSHWLVTGFFKGLTSLICRIHDDELHKVPPRGPLILYTNHVNILEIPIIYTRLQPRRVHGMVAAERWDIPVLNWALDVTETIPLHRGEADIDAIHRALGYLDRGEMLIISPEGTRSHDGILSQAHPGVVLLALHSGASLMPVVYSGAEQYDHNLKRLKRTDFYIQVGRRFKLDARGERVTATVRQSMVDEMMTELSRLLPAERRGIYAGEGSMKYLVFEE